MTHKQKKYTPILAPRELFDYLKEKSEERKSRLEAYCDLLDKASAGFVSPFLKGQECELETYQCHVTISDLASDWHWHRATVRLFLDNLENFGQLKRTKLRKSVIITMPVVNATDSEMVTSSTDADEKASADKEMHLDKNFNNSKPTIAITESLSD